MNPNAISTNEAEQVLCKHCNTPISIRNLSGFCDHLYYPDNCDICKGKSIATKTFETLANEITELEKTLREQLTAKEAVDIERNKIATDIIILKLKDHDLKDAQIKAGANLKRLMIDHSQLKRLYWEKKA